MSSKHPAWAVGRLLDFLNAARTAAAIHQSPLLSDDPKSGSARGYTIGEKTAQNILDHRAKLRFRRFQTVEEVLDVAGLGEDKLNDLLHSFSKGADEAFVDALRNGLLGENWILKPQATTYDDEASFRAVADNGEAFRRAVGKLYASAFGTDPISGARALEMKVHRAHLVNHFDAHLAAFRFAFWWYLFDFDNWFSHQRIKDACEQYLNHHGYRQPGMQLRILHLHGYESIAEHRRRLLLPVVVNYPENKITLWDAVLND
ncbi:MAG: hypothetical protein AAF990_11665 [Bacteroidota bacterium]